VVSQLVRYECTHRFAMAFRRSLDYASLADGWAEATLFRVGFPLLDEAVCFDGFIVDGRTLKAEPRCHRAPLSESYPLL
jgi:hypothetical protein